MPWNACTIYNGCFPGAVQKKSENMIKEDPRCGLALVAGIPNAVFLLDSVASEVGITIQSMRGPHTYVLRRGGMMLLDTNSGHQVAYYETDLYPRRLLPILDPGLAPVIGCGTGTPTLVVLDAVCQRYPLVKTMNAFEKVP